MKLNADMVSTSGDIVQEPTKPDNYQEGPWFYKRGGHYYMAYASTCCPEGIGYAMSDSATGPWIYKGYVVPPNKASTGNHPGIVDYKGGSYVFGFNYKLNFAITDKHHERRSVCVEKFTYNPDGSISELPWWDDIGAPQIGTLDPYRRVEAETICWSEGIKSQPVEHGGMSVRPTRDGAYIKVKGVDFGVGAKSFSVSVAAADKGGKIELHLDSTTGPLVGTCVVHRNDSAQQGSTTSCPVVDASGVHDLFLVFSGATSAPDMNIDWWKFE